MISKRSFFKKIAAVVAAVAIAPEIAFRARLELPKAEAKAEAFWFQTERYSSCISNEYAARMADIEAAGIVPILANNLHDFVMGKEA